MRTDISAAEALRIVLAEAAPGPSERVAADAALGRVLAEDVVSMLRIPPVDNSAMDGYALRSADTRAASAASPCLLRITGTSAAGAAPSAAVGAGEALRILTGAAIPDGADAVVRQEDAEHDGDAIRLRAPVEAGANVRPAGEDVEPGQSVLFAGMRLGPGALGVLASLQRSRVAVHVRPRVALLSGGDELVAVDGDVSGGRIVASNAHSLAAACREAGAAPFDLGIARDEPESIAEHLRAGLRADFLVSSAGVSVGDRDHMRAVLTSLGCRMLFWGVEIKPGYPLLFGRFEGGPIVFGLPGNPVSALVTFELFVRPALLRFGGARRLFRPRVEAELAETLRKSAGRMHFVRVRLERNGARWRAHSTGNQSSGVLRSMSEADGLLIFPAESTQIAAGEKAQVIVLDADALAAEGAGF